MTEPDPREAYSLHVRRHNGEWVATVLEGKWAGYAAWHAGAFPSAEAAFRRGAQEMRRLVAQDRAALRRAKGGK